VLEEESEIEATTELVTREVRNKKAVDVVALQQVLQIASEIEVPTSNLVRENVSEDAQKVIELAEDIQEFVTEEAGELLKITAEHQGEEGTSEDAASKVTQGNNPSHNTSNNITDLDTSSPSSSLETSPTPSPVNQTSKLDDVGTSEPLSIDDTLGALVD